MNWDYVQIGVLVLILLAVLWWRLSLQKWRVGNARISGKGPILGAMVVLVGLGLGGYLLYYGQVTHLPKLDLPEPTHTPTVEHFLSLFPRVVVEAFLAAIMLGGGVLFVRMLWRSVAFRYVIAIVALLVVVFTLGYKRRDMCIDGKPCGGIPNAAPHRR